MYMKAFSVNCLTDKRYRLSHEQKYLSGKAQFRGKKKNSVEFSLSHLVRI